MKGRNLYLITDGFPFGKGEKPFILPELPYLLEEYNLTIISPAPQAVVDDVNYTTKLDDRIKLVHLVPPPMNNIQVDQPTLNRLMQNPVLQEELQYIREDGKLLNERANEALGNFVIAELFFQQVQQAKAINFDEPCLIYTFWYHFRTLAFCLHKDEFPNMKIITRAHGYDLYNERTAFDRQPFKSFMNTKLDGIFFVSRKGLNYYSSKFTKNLNPDKLHYSSLGIEKVPKGSNQTKMSKFHLISCSNVIPLKRVELIIQALALCDENVNIHWTHFGEGSLMQDMKKFADAQLKDKQNITYWFMGHIPNEEVMRYYSSIHCSCFITTSSTEGTPVSIQEALSFGIPIIGTDVGGINEEIDNNGILLSPNPSPQEVADAITKIYKMSDEQIEKLRQRSIEIYEERYNIENNAKRFLRFLKNL